MEVNFDTVKKIIKNYVALDLYKVYFGGNIPQEIMINAQINFPLTNAKKALLLYDSSTFGNGKTGIAICDNGVFYKNDKFSEPCYKHFSWEEFSSVNIYMKGSNIYFDNEYYVYFPTVITTVEAITKLLKAIQKSLLNGGKYIEELEQTKEEKVPEEGKVWKVVLGPMDKAEIEKLLLEKFLNPETATAWKKGMDAWMVFNDIPELKAVSEGLSNNNQQAAAKNPAGNNVTEVNKKIDINTCQADDLLSIDCMDMHRINYLIEKRQSGKKFYTLEDVAELLDLKPHEVEELKDKIVFNLSRVVNGVRRIEF